METNKETRTVPSMGGWSSVDPKSNFHNGSYINPFRTVFSSDQEFFPIGIQILASCPCLYFGRRPAPEIEFSSTNVSIIDTRFKAKEEKNVKTYLLSQTTALCLKICFATEVELSECSYF